MKKQIMLLGGLVLAGALALAGCGSQPAGDSAVYESADGWSVTYNPTVMSLNEEDGNANFVYAGECAGTDMVSVSYVADKMPQEVLYEKTADIDDSLITRSEGMFGATGAWAFTYSVASPEQSSGLCEQFSAIEHNGGTLLIDILTHTEADEEQAQTVSDAIEALVDSIVFTNHQPQQQFSYVPGIYAHEYTEELDGQTSTYTYTIQLNEDHTGVMNTQDTVNIIWTSTELIGDGFSYEYTVEGDGILVNLGVIWESFDKVPEEGDLVDNDFSQYAGTYTSENQDTLTVDENGNVEISIVRLTSLEGTASGIYKGIMPISVTDASGNPMGLEFNVETKELIVVDSTWSLLPNGETFDLSK